jgi:hypothetical protein
MRLVRLILLSLVLAAGCSREKPETEEFQIEGAGFLSLEVRDETGKRTRLIHDAELSAGTHRLEQRNGKVTLDGQVRADVPPGKWQWAAVVHGEIKAEVRSRPWRWPSEANDAATPGGDDGGPRAVAADEAQVYLGWSGAIDGSPVAAVDSDGTVRWTHRESGRCGVRALAAEQGAVFVLGHGGDAVEPASVVYKLDAKTGVPMPWEGKSERFLRIVDLWPANADLKPISADALTVANGRLYLSFTQPGFIAVLDARDGKYVTTLSGPEPGPMALSTTPMKAVDGSGKTEIADFGVAILMGRAASYFVMPHDPPWVAMNTTRWLAEDERITAFTMRADTMKSGEVQLFFGLDAPQAQVQVRPASEPTGFTFSVGKPGGRAALGPWQADALRDICSLAIDVKGQLWVAERGAWPKRFSVWTTTGKEARLVREYFGPFDAGCRGAAVFPDDPNIFVAQGCEWHIDPATGLAACLGVIVTEGMEAARFARYEGRTILVVEQTDSSGSPGSQGYERLAAGDWRKIEIPAGSEWPRSSVSLPEIATLEITSSGESLQLAAAEAPFSVKLAVGREARGFASTAEGRIFFAAGTAELSIVELTGLWTVRKIGMGTWSVGAGDR